MGTSEQLAISVRGVVKTYQVRRGRETTVLNAVDGIDLDIAHGEVFALLGPNGAGKSTTVEILEGYRNPTAGVVSVLGEDPRYAGAGWRSKIGIVLQSTKDLGDLTIRESIDSFAAFFAAPMPTAEAMHLTGLSEHADKRGKQLSGGLRRRLDVALGIIGRPELLFLDEPTTGFDPDARRQFWGLIRTLNEQGTTIVLTSHYLDEVEALAHRIGVIVHGRLAEVNTPDRLGGRGDAAAVLRYRDPSGQVVRRATDTPGSDVAALVAQHGEMAELTISRPSLEDAYLAMIGFGENDV